MTCQVAEEVITARPLHLAEQRMNLQQLQGVTLHEELLLILQTSRIAILPQGQPSAIRTLRVIHTIQVALIAVLVHLMEAVEELALEAREDAVHQVPEVAAEDNPSDPVF